MMNKKWTFKDALIAGIGITIYGFCQYIIGYICGRCDAEMKHLEKEAEEIENINIEV